jgi:hypothetical protein
MVCEYRRETEREKKIFILVYFSPDPIGIFSSSQRFLIDRPPCEPASELARVSRVSRNSNRRRVDVTLPFDLIGQPTPAITATFLPSFFPSHLSSNPNYK